MTYFIKKYFLLGILLLISALALGCASNNFSKYYSGANLESVQANPRYVVIDAISSGELPQLPPDEIAKTMFTTGYERIGASAWRGSPSYGNDAAIDHAKKIGASSVLWRADYAYTNSGIREKTYYYGGERVTRYHTHNVYSEGKAYKVRAKSIRRRPVYTRTEYIPYSIDIFDYNAIFLAKLKPGNFGLMMTEPDEVYRRKFDTSFGALVMAVQKDGRAYQENILEGDIIETVNGLPFRNGETDKWVMGENVLEIYRDGKKLTKKVFFGNQPIKNQRAYHSN